MKRASTIPEGITLEGDVEGDGDLVVLGRIDGEIRIGGAVVVESSGAVRGDVHGRTVTVRGVVVGDAYGAELIRVDEGGRVVGDATAPRVKIVEGAGFRGRVRMGEDPGVQPVRRRRVRSRSRSASETPAGPERETASDGQPQRTEVPGDTLPGSLQAPSEPPRPRPVPRMPSVGRRRGRRMRG